MPNTVLKFLPSPPGTGVRSLHSDDGEPIGRHYRGTWRILLPGVDNVPE